MSYYPQNQFLAAESVDFIVTGNKRHFPPRVYGAIRVVNAAQMLDRITLGRGRAIEVCGSSALPDQIAFKFGYTCKYNHDQAA
jgi:hypothetical protein